MSAIVQGIRQFFSSIIHLFAWLLWPMGALFSLLFGTVQWKAPLWMQAINNKYRSLSSKFRLLLSLLMATLLLTIWGCNIFLSRPEGVQIMVRVQAPPAPDIGQSSPQSLDIIFDFDRTKSTKERIPNGAPSVAPLTLIGKTVTQHIRLIPDIAGKWTWVSDHGLRFTPKKTWPADQTFDVDMQPALFAPNTPLRTFSYEFKTAPFKADIENMRLHQNPLKKTEQKVVAQLSFSHPVDLTALTEKIALRFTDESRAPIPFNIKLTEKNRLAYITSAPIALPNHESYALLTLKKGTPTLSGSATTQKALSKKILLPDASSFVKVSNVESRIVRTQENIPEQVLMLHFTDDISENSLRNHLKLYLLPKNKYYRAGEVTDAVLARSKIVPLDVIPGARPESALWSLRMDEPVGKKLYVSIEAGLQGASGYSLTLPYKKILYTPKYPRELKILGEGGLLTLSGDKTLGFATRGLEGVKITVGRMLEGQLNHLITQTRGDINHPSFKNYHFSEDNITEKQVRYLPLSSGHPKRLNYASFSLAPYLKEQGLGVFFVNIEGTNKKRKTLYGTSQNRMMVVTDLGLIVKKSINGEQDIFVESLKTGKPVKGAKVSLLAANGLPLMTDTTDASGHVRMPKADTGDKSRYPVVFSVSKQKDAAFLPWARSARQINFSRFDTGGIYANRQQDNQLTAFMFSDRGIYRPGETAHIGAIIRRRNLEPESAVPVEFLISDPRGNQVLKQKTHLNKEGFLEVKLPTEKSSPTGHYTASVYLLHKRGYHKAFLGSTQFNVEAFQADTLKITAQIKPSMAKKWSKKGWLDELDVKGHVSLGNLFGTPAQQRKVTGRLSLTPVNFAFGRYADFHFTDPLRDDKANSQTLRRTLPQQLTNADGKADFDLTVDNFKAGTYRLSFTAEGFEPDGGRSVKASSQILISPLHQLVGYKADGDLSYLKRNQTRKLTFIAIDPSLNPLALAGLHLQRVLKQAVSTLVRQPNGTYQYETMIKDKLLDSQDVDIAATGKSLLLNTRAAGQYELRLLDDSNTLISRVSYDVAAEGNMAGNLEKEAVLSLKLNKKDYKAGDTIEMNIVAPYTGTGLITIERDKLYAHQWFKTRTLSSIQHIRIPDNLEGNAYVNVTFVRAPDAKEVFVSPMSYAVKSFNIDRSKRKLQIDLDVPKRVKPGDPFTVTYRTNKPGKIIIYGVNEGILQVAKYTLPSPLNHFLKKQALQVSTSQILDLIQPEYRLLKEAAGIGGGMPMMAEMQRALSKNLNPFARTLDTPAVFWSTILDTDSTDRTQRFTLPDSFSGNMKVMAVAVSDEAMGATSQNMLVRGPFVLSPNVLTVAAPKDRFTLTLGVANGIEGSGDKAEINVSLNVSPQLKVIGPTEQTLIIGEGDEGKAQFEVEALDRLGAANIRFKAQWKTAFSARSASLSVRPAQVYATEIESGYAKSGDADTQLSRWLYPQLATQTLSASASPLMMATGMLTYLENYPHGCTEQLVSQVFPWLNLSTAPEFSDHLEKAHEQFNTLISRLRQRQLSNGGFSLWPGGQTPDAFASLYAIHFLTDAQEAHFPVPNDMMQGARNYLQSAAQHTGSRRSQSDGSEKSNLRDERLRAIAIYLLTRQGKVATNYLLDLHKELLDLHSELKPSKDKTPTRAWEQDITAAYMAASYRLLQKNELANRLIAGFKLGNKVQDATDFQSQQTMDAQYIYLVAKHFPKQLEKLDIDSLMPLTKPKFYSRLNTISAAYNTLALNAWSEAHRKAFGKDAIVFKIQDRLALINKTEKSLKTQRFPSISIPLAESEDKLQTLSMQADHPLFYQWVQTGFARTPPKKAVNKGLEVIREYLDKDGNPISQLKQGEEVNVRLRIRSLDKDWISNVAVIDLLPAGFEVIRSSVPRRSRFWSADYVDIREDRINFYGGFSRQLTELHYRVKATTAGHFVTPPAYAKSMYDPMIYSHSAASEFVVSGGE